MDREDRRFLLIAWIIVAAVYALETYAPRAELCDTDTSCADIDDHPAAGAPDPR